MPLTDICTVDATPVPKPKRVRFPLGGLGVALWLWGTISACIYSYKTWPEFYRKRQ